MRNNRQLFLITLLMLMALVLVACGGDDDGGEGEDDPLPTLASDVEETEETEDTPPNGPPGVDVDEVPTLESNLPPGLDTNSGPPILGGNTDGDSPDGPPFGDSSGPPIGNSGGVAPTVVTDFSTLEDGNHVTLLGMVNLSEETDSDGDPVGYIVDDNGVQVRIVNLPFTVLGSMDGMTELTGQVEMSDDGLVTLDVTPSQAQPGETNANNLPFIDADEEAPFNNDGPNSELPGSRETLDITLEAELTALQAYDALIPQLTDLNLEEAELVEISGNNQEGWGFRFNLPAENQTVVYYVKADGTVEYAPPAPMAPIPVVSSFAFERDEVVVDSDVAEENLLVTSEDGPPIFNAVQLKLSATEEGEIQWSTTRGSGSPLDATTAP